ncbi:hypothetical protein [Ktedonospora formicarum]|uniref:Uncharacterized protein n=1 Tax=Ktedonospora formicarum TaxID=2778364 RepID=A0A8J3HTC0_9CHLR|nr:hypothetical protein [Ktedonospora formicarum]GHO42891.1 hypothetical protein KSX_10540 [Ktedonospora formicarum]
MIVIELIAGCLLIRQNEQQGQLSNCIDTLTGGTAMLTIKNKTRTTEPVTTTKRWNIGTEQPQLRRTVTVAAPVSRSAIHIPKHRTYVYTRLHRSLLRRGVQEE